MKRAQIPLIPIRIERPGQSGQNHRPAGMILQPPLHLFLQPRMSHADPRRNNRQALPTSLKGLETIFRTAFPTQPFPGWFRLKLHRK